MKIIKIEEDKQFILKQRERGRPFCMIGAVRNLSEKEKRKLKHQERIKGREERMRKTSFPSTSTTIELPGEHYYSISIAFLNRSYNIIH